MFTKVNFTSSVDISNFEVGDNSVDIIGYVTQIRNNLHTPTKAKFHKFVINNNDGKEVQVIAWNDNIKVLQDVKEIGSIVHIGSARCCAIKNQAYNSGNVDFELQIKENSTITIHDAFTEVQEEDAEEMSITESYKCVNKKIKIDGIMKTELRRFRLKDFDYFIGSITDGTNLLEVKSAENCSSLNIRKGESVVVTGVIELFPPGPPVLRIEKLKDIKKINRERVSFSEVYAGFKNY